MIKMTEVNNGVKMHDYSIIIIVVHWSGVDPDRFPPFYRNQTDFLNDSIFRE